MKVSSPIGTMPFYKPFLYIGVVGSLLTLGVIKANRAYGGVKPNNHAHTGQIVPTAKTITGQMMTHCPPNARLCDLATTTLTKTAITTSKAF